MKTYTGKTLDEILQKIISEQDVEMRDISYTVLEEKNGFFGVGKEITIEAYTGKDIMDFIYDYIQQYFENIGMDVEVSLEEVDGVYKVNLNTSHNAIVIGKAGQTLQAINTVLKAAVSSTFKKHIPCLVDINRYKEDRYEKIILMATRIAKTVARSKTDALLDPMPNDERKAIHNQLSGMEHIATISEGEGKDRRLRIVYVK